VDYDSAGQSFMEMVRDLSERLDRAEKILGLFVAPLQDVVISWAALTQYLDGKCDEHDPHPGEREWRRDFTYRYIHKSGIRCNFENGIHDQEVLRSAILTVAACEGVMPMRLMETLQPGCFGVVDLLAEAGNEPGT